MARPLAETGRSAGRASLPPGFTLGSPDLLKEDLDLTAQGRRVAGQCTGCSKHLGSRRPGVSGRPLNLDDAMAHLLRSPCGLADIAGDLLRGRLLLLDGRRNARGDLVHFLDGQTDVPDRLHGPLRGLLNLIDV